MDNKNSSRPGIDASKVGAVAGAVVGDKYGVLWAGAGALLGLVLGQSLAKAPNATGRKQKFREAHPHHV